jgi:hypothetical protein
MKTKCRLGFCLVSTFNVLNIPRYLTTNSIPHFDPQPCSSLWPQRVIQFHVFGIQKHYFVVKIFKILHCKEPGTWSRPQNRSWIFAMSHRKQIWILQWATEKRRTIGVMFSHAITVNIKHSWKRRPNVVHLFFLQGRPLLFVDC